MVGHSNIRKAWAEAAGSAFAVASALPVTMNSMQIAELFDKVESGETQLNCTLTQEISSIRNASGESLLIVACRVGNVEIVKQLVAVDPESIDDTDNEGWSALLNAAQHGHLGAVIGLIEGGASVDQPDLMGWTPLMWAVYKNRFDIVDVLIRNQAHINLVDEEDGLNPLILAAGRGFHSIVDRLISADCQVNACDKFGSTALIWAARKGHAPVVESLLNAGAEVDAVGMYSSTALMLATRGNYLQVVDLLLTREPNVNVADTNGLTALGIAAREGYADICESLIRAGAFVNQCDRFGNWILISAVRSGNASIVRMLLEKFADINCQDSDKRTPLHLAIDKSYTDIAYILLERKPNLELRNKEGETPLLRAAKCRHVHLCSYLISAGSKLAATDNAGDNALHLALRARSKRLTQVLLANPSDSRLLYRPNKLGRTPYSLDMESQQPILPLIFGRMDTDDKMDTVMGYDVYSNVLADILSEPSLSLPMTIGLYAKWGSGKSALLGKLEEAMLTFSRDWLDGASLIITVATVFNLFVAAFIGTLCLTTAIAIFGRLDAYLITWIVSGSMFLLTCVALVIIHYGDKRGWESSIDTANFLARVKNRIALIFTVLTVHAPLRNENDSCSSPISFLFADYHRLSSIGGEQSLAKIVATLYEAAERHFGILPVRLFCSMRLAHAGTSGSLRRHCGVPHLILIVVSLLLFTASLLFLDGWLLFDRDPASPYLYISISFFLGFAMIAFYPIVLAFKYTWSNIPRRRVNAAARNTHKLRFEGLMQKLQVEVDLLAELIRSLDTFTRSHTRLVIVADGLDNCEQEKMVQTLDALELLFSAKRDQPFIVIIAVDPHVIVSAINHSMHSALSGTELTGHDYLRNIISMPFYMHNSALRQLQTKLKEKRESLADWRERFKRQDTFHGSHLSLRDIDSRQSRKKSSAVQMNGMVRAGGGGGGTGGRSLTEGMLGDDYFSNMNPRAMRRIVSALTLTGRLMRAFEIEFSWTSLGHWVALLEQWPSRMCWLIDRALEVHNNSLLLSEVYHQLKDHIPNNDELIAMDRNQDNFETFLDSKGLPPSERLTVAHVKKFVPCTSNLDPYLRKLIRERSKGLVDIESQLGSAGMAIPPNARLLFNDEIVWLSINTPLVEMKLEKVIQLLRKIDMPSQRVENVVERFTVLNLCGLVLATCSSTDLKESLQLPLGDWTMIKLLIETLKVFGSTPPGLKVDKRKVLTLREEDEEGEMEEAAEIVVNSERAPLFYNPREEQRRRSVVMANELADDHKWLMESLSGMDLTETEGDQDETPEDRAVSQFSSTDAASPLIELPKFGSGTVSATPSVRFEEDIHDLEKEASDNDSTKSRYDSRENLLEQQEEEEDNDDDGYSNGSVSRTDLMRGMHNSAQVGDLSATTSSDDLAQETVQRKLPTTSPEERIQLDQIFNRAPE